MKKNFNFYNKDNKPFARQLRKHSTLSEIIMWNEILKSRKLYGYQFKRQRPIGNYIVDFFCNDLKLIIELDGETHIIKQEKDRTRQSNLEGLGYTIIRFRDIKIENITKVKNILENWVKDYENKFPEVKEMNNRKRKNR